MKGGQDKFWETDLTLGHLQALMLQWDSHEQTPCACKEAC